MGRADRANILNKEKMFGNRLDLTWIGEMSHLTLVTAGSGQDSDFCSDNFIEDTNCLQLTS